MPREDSCAFRTETLLHVQPLSWPGAGTAQAGGGQSLPWREPVLGEGAGWSSVLWLSQPLQSCKGWIFWAGMA